MNTSHVAIGGTFPFERNLISGHTDAGVVTERRAFMAIRGNLIGTDAAGTAAAATGLFGHGLRLDIAAFAQVGGTDPAARNVISGVGDRAIIVSNADSTVSVVGNFIGTDVTGTQVIGDTVGIDIIDASPLIRGNVIAGQGTVGVSLERSSSVIQGNFIGTDETATLLLGNPAGDLRARGERTSRSAAPRPRAQLIAHNGRISFPRSEASTSIPRSHRANPHLRNLYLGNRPLERRPAARTPTIRAIRRGTDESQNFPIITNVMRPPARR